MSKRLNVHVRFRQRSAGTDGCFGTRPLDLGLWSAIIRVVFVSALPLSSDHALALAIAMEYS
jgi:hypothetical protein